MQKLCFGTFITILGYCAAPRTLDRILCGKLLLAVNNDYDICTDSTTTSKLKNGYSNLSALVTEKIAEINPCDIAIGIEENLLPLLDSSKYAKVIATLLIVLEEDSEIYDDAEIDKLRHLTKAELLTKKEFVFSELLAGLLVYIALYTDNIRTNEYVKKLTSEYVEIAGRKRPNIKIYDRKEKAIHELKKEKETDIAPDIREKDRKVLKIAALIGGWHDDYKGDRIAPENYFEIKAEKFQDEIKSDLRLYDDLLKHKDKKWRFNNHKDILFEVSDLIFDEDIEALFKLANDIFLETNPKYDLVPEQRHIANVMTNGKHLTFSNSLKKGVMESIAIICNDEAKFVNCSYGKIKNTIYTYERNLLTEKDWKFYASIADYLNELAEACPDVFLERLQTLLECEDEAFLTFLHEKETFIVEQKYGYQLSEALRHLAISEAYFARTMLALIKLAKYQDLFLNTLVTIVLPWYPQTNAILNIRTGVFKGLTKEDDETTWKALMKLMPNVTTNSSEICIPNYMHVDSMPGQVSQRDYFTATRAYVLTAVELINRKTDRIIDMIGVIDDVPEELQDVILKAICDNSVGLNDFEKEKIWNKKEDFVKRHRKFADTSWAINEKRLQYIENFLKDLWPDSDPYILVRLFRNNQFSLMEDEDWNDGKKKLQNKQISEVEKIYKSEGIEEILTLENKVENEHLLGRTMAYVFSQEEFNLFIVKQSFDLHSEFITGLLEAVNRKWIFELADSLDAKILAIILASVFADDEVIIHVQKMDDQAKEIYFKNIRVYGISEMTEEHLLFLLEGVNKASRSDVWIHIMYEAISNFIQKPDEEYLVDGLNAIDVGFNLASHEIFEVQQLLRYAQENCKNYDKLLNLEWKYLNILDEDDGLYPINLWNEMAKNPEFFIELIKTLAGKRRNELSTEYASKIYSHNYKLLHGWRLIPGSIKGGRHIDTDVLNKWFSEVKRMAIDEEILDLAMDYCGKLFFYAPEDESDFFINKVIAEILEHESNSYIRTGYEIAAINSRGCITVDPTGQDDFEIEEIYQKKARDAEAEGFIRLADSLRSVADSFHEDGLMHRRMHND